MMKGLRSGVLIVAASVWLCAVPDAQAQGVTGSVDPTAIQSEITANPDFDIAGLWKTLKIPSELDTVYAKVGAAPLASARIPFDRCSNACRVELTRANVDDDLSDEAVLAVYQ